MDLEKLRASLHQAIDRAIDDLEGNSAVPKGPAQGPDGSAIQVVAAGDHDPFDHRWPLDVIEHFTSGRSYTLTDQGRTLPVVAGRTERDAWGRPRNRVVIFGLSGSGARYPWAEFVESDDGRYSAALPADPAASRRQLKDGAAVPDRFRSAVLERTDALFDSVRKGPALRLVVGPDDVVEMVEFGYWLAGQRKKL